MSITISSDATGNWITTKSCKDKSNETLTELEYRVNGTLYSETDEKEAILNVEGRKYEDDEELKKRVKFSPRVPGNRDVKTKTYERSSIVSELAKRRAGGRCQLCSMESPFKTKDGSPYLETHHIVWLSNGGEDTPENTVALCPNCHRKMHSLNLKKDRDFLIDAASN